MGWSDKYKKSIDCNNPKGFSQRAHCQGRKKKMSEEKKDHEYHMARSQLKTIKNAANRLEKKMGKKGEGELKAWVQSKITKAADYIDTAADYVTNEETVNEEGLRDWFGKSKSKDGKGGWVNVVTGGTCASDEPGEGTPKCVSSAKRASMSKKERLSAARRKKAADPGQQQKTGAAKPTYVSTDKPKKKMKEGVEDINAGGRRDAMKDAFDDMRKTKYDPTAGKKRGKKLLDRLLGVPPVAEENVTEAKDKKGKGSGTKDACYHKVKSRYSVWPSAYASGALVKCRKVGAANWGNSTKKEEYMSLPEMTDIQINALRKAGFEVEVIDEKCWKGYEKKGMKTMFGKRYPNCVKKEETEIEEANKPAGVRGAYDKNPPGQYQVGDTIPASATGESDYKKRRMDTLKRILKDNPKNWDFSQQNVDRRQVSGESVEPMTTAEEAEVRYCPKCEKNETREECVYGGKYWDENSMPAKDVKEATIELTDSYGDTFATIETETKVEESKKEVELDTYDIESMTEAVRIPAKTGNIVMVNLGWKGKYYSIKMFFPQVSKPSRKDVQDQIEKIYPGGKLYTFVVSNYEPGEPMLHAEGAAWTKKEGKSKSGGLNEKGRKSYERENPGSDLKAPSKKVGNPRRKSFCARMKGMKAKLTSKKTARDPDSRINKSLRAWNC